MRDHERRLLPGLPQLRLLHGAELAV